MASYNEIVARSQPHIQSMGLGSKSNTDIIDILARTTQRGCRGSSPKKDSCSPQTFSDLYRKERSVLHLLTHGLSDTHGVGQNCEVKKSNLIQSVVTK